MEMENTILTDLNDFLILLENISENDLKQKINRLACLRNNEEKIFNYIKENKYFSPIENTNIQLLSIKDIYDFLEIKNVTFIDFYKKYIHIFIFWMLLRNYIYKPEYFKLLTNNNIQLIFNKSDKKYLNNFLNIFGYTCVNNKSFNNKQYISLYTFNYNNIKHVYENNIPIIKKYKYQFVFNNKIENDLFICKNKKSLTIGSHLNCKKFYDIKEFEEKFNQTIFGAYIIVSNIIKFGNTVNIRILVKNRIIESLYFITYNEYEYNNDLKY